MSLAGRPVPGALIGPQSISSRRPQPASPSLLIPASVTDFILSGPGSLPKRLLRLCYSTSPGSGRNTAINRRREEGRACGAHSDEGGTGRKAAGQCQPRASTVGTRGRVHAGRVHGGWGSCLHPKATPGGRVSTTLSPRPPIQILTQGQEASPSSLTGSWRAEGTGHRRGFHGF